ncbi:TPA: hypothetical protein OMP93_000126 [Acinetobacter baumannii]|nr:MULTISPECIES: hypothetical protein [Acinetobacter calcoaceticus/baumannii complex]MCW1512830.1 hypothetical protein [Acinetobacter baumannii]MRA47231.1 hypothetical protein [Acinetobacter pittii]OTU37066.1 hypothetical protein CAT58_08450 [Acinetobacter pittii]HCQ9568426.1 hypothetical protein [Acinetobacter baumannii]HDU8502870.1 hypothetical protein [Acinetobacter baumannii]
MEKLFIILMLVIPSFVYAQDRTIDERCHGYADQINKLLVNRYEHETQKEQLELINEIDDKEYRDNLSKMLKYIYTLPLYKNEKDVKIQFLNQYIASYRMCIQLYIDR